MTKQHNESLAEKAADIASSNGVFNAGETGIKFAKDETGMKFGLRFTNRELFSLVLGLSAGILAKNILARGVASAARGAANAAETAAEVVE